MIPIDWTNEKKCLVCDMLPFIVKGAYNFATAFLFCKQKCELRRIHISNEDIKIKYISVQDTYEISKIILVNI